MKQALQLKLSQHLTLTPQLQQSIKLLQLSTLELNQEVERYLLDNPLLERDEVDGFEHAATGEINNGSASLNEASFNDNSSAPSDNTDFNHDAPPNPDNSSTASESTAEFAEDGSGGDFSTSGFEDGGMQIRTNKDPGDDDGERTQIAAAEISLADHLIQQLQLMQLSDYDRKLASYIVAHLEADGYLHQPLDELEAALEGVVPLEEGDLMVALRLVQSLDPIGVGARNLSECLLLQLRARTTPKSSKAELAIIAIAKQLVSHHLQLLAARDFTKLKRALGCIDAELKLAQELIVSLEPKPGRDFDSGDVRYVMPDVVVRKHGGKWKAMLNQDAMPKLRVNRMYANLLQSTADGSGKNLSGQLQEARWLVKNIAQRYDTILRVTQAIVNRQRHFFEHGEVAMRPLVLREIADEVELHESTISRVTTQKYMMTPRGIFELKYFFGSSVATDSGGTCSATAIRALIKQFVDAENCRKPLSDNTISDMLNKQGIVVARRTIAKYRESLQIQPASMRKTM